MKLVIIPNKVDDINKYDNDTFIIGLEKYSINYPTASLQEIKELSNKYNLFIAINKNIFNSEHEDIKNVLIELSKINILGVMYYDIGLLNIVIENNIDIDLVWHQTHMVTNYNTCNYYNSKGVKYAYLANEITIDEILEIKEKTDMLLLVEIFGYPIMSYSRRSLLSNYLKINNIKKEDRTYHLSDDDNNYFLKETNNGTCILYGRIINGTKPLFDLINNINYFTLDMQEVDEKIGMEVFNTYKYIINNYENISLEEKNNIINKMNDLIGDSTNFFYKKTIYKVK